MIRFRLGTRWKRQPKASPLDSFGLELDGVELLPSASEEPLLEVVPRLLEAVDGLGKADGAVAQVSLTEAHLELCLFRRGAEIELSVVSLSRPAQLSRSARADLTELQLAAARCARTLVQDAGETISQVRKRRMLKAAEALETARPAGEEKVALASFGSLRVSPEEPGQLGFTLEGELARMAAFQPKDGHPLPSLLVQGELFLRLGEGETSVWRAKGVPYLWALELSRQAAEIARAIELSEETFGFQPGGVGAKVELELSKKTARLGAKRYPLDPERLLKGIAALGPELLLAVRGQVPRQSKNPYLVELVARCREVGHALKPLRERAADAPRPKRTASKPQSPLPGPGTLKKVRFEPSWEARALEKGARGEVRVGPKGPVVASPELAAGYTRQGALRFRSASPHGVAVASDGTVLSVGEDRILLYRPEVESAIWLRSHDGFPIGPWVERRGSALYAMSEGRAAVAIDGTSGRELWRLAPPRTQRAELSFHAGLAWMATDSGFLFGADLLDGQLHVRVRAPMPFVQKAEPLGAGVVTLLARGSSSALLALPPSGGEVNWTAELALSRPTFAVQGGKVLVAGEREGEARAVLLDGRGKTIWDRPAPIGRGPYFALPFQRSWILVDGQGAAVRLEKDGRVGWRIGEGEESPACAVEPVLSRQLFLLPGSPVRAVDPSSGEVLGEIDAGPGLSGLAADGRLDVYALDEDGKLKAFRLATHLAVVR